MDGGIRDTHVRITKTNSPPPPLLFLLLLVVLIVVSVGRRGGGGRCQTGMMYRKPSHAIGEKEKSTSVLFGKRFFCVRHTLDSVAKTVGTVLNLIAKKVLTLLQMHTL